MPVSSLLEYRKVHAAIEIALWSAAFLDGAKRLVPDDIRAVGLYMKDPAEAIRRGLVRI
jgi:hypothetical protein